jgi:endonuclease III
MMQRRLGKAMQRAEIESVLTILAAETPDPVTALDYRDRFQLLIAVILSAQSTDVAVNRVTPVLFAKAPCPEAMVKLGVEGIKAEIRSLGLYNAKAKHIHACCRLLISDYQSQVPSNRADLERLPGVGRKTAGVILNVAFQQPTIPVDTHVFRVANRIGLVQAGNPLETERQLLQVVPERFRRQAHHLLILHGRRVCTARKPSCPRCPVTMWCRYPNKTV